MNRQIVPIMPTPLLVVDDFVPLTGDYPKLIEDIDHVFANVTANKHLFQCDVQSTYREYNIGHDERFHDINVAVYEQVNFFANSLGGVRKQEMFDGWLNRYAKGQHQEMHHHGNFHFSAIYFAEFAKGSAPLLMENKNFPLNEILFDREVETGWQRVTALEPEPNTLIVFPSNTFHMVPPHKIEERRTTIAWNFRELEHDQN